MKDILKRTTLGALLLLLLPLAVMVSGWRWQPVEMGLGHQILFWFTETVTRPWGTLTSAILCGWFLWCLRFRLKPAVFLLAIIVGAILLGQYTKGVIKEQVREPRPYVLWLEQQRGVNPETFYQQHRKQRSQLVSEAVAEDKQLPGWLKRHWAFETGFAFPSGHTMFAASWALLGVGLLWPRRRYVTIIVLLVWASLVMGSRLALGMHWPRDLIVATLFSWLFVTLATWLAVRFCGPLGVPLQEQQEIAERENEP
ncbi:phosphatidylglycerophosphatase B [Erwinia sp. Leaf53]|uniref:phosphatidylglycerophosphatase B n=1 Tax=Erwinia sp. Leaf53 TaxID=1736225 RepID=UPI0006F4A9FA|nr:phosphatidylglycerophosphatase B [Erwinia sp. Leaf53]KQN55780.1 phosphatidylglycerophosphatase [Erwinia sp. Leaf53]